MEKGNEVVPSAEEKKNGIVTPAAEKKNETVTSAGNKDISAENNLQKYPSAGVFLDIAEKEFNREDDRANKLHAKAGILLSIIVVLFTFYVPTMKINAIVVYPATTFLEWAPLFVLLAFYAITVICSLLSLIFLILVVYTASYERFNYSDLCKDANLSAQKEIAQVTLTKKYCEMANKNLISNNKKVIHYRRGSVCLVISLICIAITTFYASVIL